MFRDGGPGVICHTYASRLTGDEQPTHTTGRGHVFLGFVKAFQSPRHPTPLKHANVPALCSNWSQ